jgi:hypothetical protein
MFPHRNIHKHTWTSPDEKTHNQIDHVLIDRRQRSTMNVGPCHHGMARPQVADGGTASDMEGSCE